MQTSIRLLLTALLVCGITYAAAGAPISAEGVNGNASPSLVASSLR